MRCKRIRTKGTQSGVFCFLKKGYFQSQVSTVKLGFKKLLDKVQLGNSEPFPVINMPVHLMNSEKIDFSEQIVFSEQIFFSEQIVFSEQLCYDQKVPYYQV